MKLSIFIKRLKHPRVRRRLKIALSVYAVVIILSISFKTVYNIGYFNAKALDDEKRAKRNSTPFVQRMMTKEYAQRIISSALKENPIDPQTIVERISNSNRKLSSIVIKNNGVKKVAWIIDMRLFFVGNILDERGYSLTKAVERKHNIINSY
ncbi:MAG: hypothetical protein Q9M50_01190 [Methylococcales bacterium]|nr:hypothetical protein [Methylococcales bacterium]